MAWICNIFLPTVKVQEDERGLGEYFRFALPYLIDQWTRHDFWAWLAIRTPKQECKSRSDESNGTEEEA